MAQPVERLAGDDGHAQLVDVAHGEDVDAAADEPLALQRVQVADADLDDLRRLERWSGCANVEQRRRAFAHQRGDGHAVDVAAG